MQATKRSRRGSALLAVAALLGLFAIAGPSNALTPGIFENDGNLLGDRDWGGAYTAGDIDCEGSDAKNCGIDLPTGQNDNSFGQGAKEDTAVPSVVSGSIPNNKSDLTRLYVVDFTAADGDEMLAMAWERVQEPTGTTNMDFEFNQSSTLSTNGVTPVRTAGDLLIKYDLSQGGVNPSFGYHRWIDGSDGETKADCEAANSLPCWDKVHALDPAVAVGSVNTASVQDPIPPGEPRTLSPRTFGEAVINLTDSGLLDPSECTSFGRAYLKSRSSDSFTAALKDFIAPIPVEISNCKPLRIVKTSTAGGNLVAKFKLYLDDGDGAFEQGTQDTIVATASGVTECTTASSAPLYGTCDYKLTSLGTYWIFESQAPTGYSLIDPNPASVNISAFSATVQTVSIFNSPSPGTINVSKTDASTGLAMDGVTFTLYNDVAPIGGTKGTGDDTAVGVCVTGVASSGNSGYGEAGSSAGTCKFTNVPVGDYWVVETVPTGYTNTNHTRSVNVSLVAGGDVDNLTFVNTPIPGRINVSKTNDAGTAMDGVTFTLYTDVAPQSDDTATTKGVEDTSSVGVCVTGVASSGNSGYGVAGAAPGTCSFTNVPVGKYWVIETVPSGYSNNSATRHVTVATVTSSNTGDVDNLTFVNNRLFKVIVLVCQESDNSLYSSSVTINNGTQKNSLGTAPAGGPTEAQLCALGGATESGLTKSAAGASYPATISIPNAENP